MLKVGEMAPDFTLPDQTGEEHKLSDYRGKIVFLYFYPKDDTPGCTTEACSVRDNFDVLTKLGVHVFGLSVDSVKSHEKFVNKYALNFDLLSDVEKKVVDVYQVWEEKSFMGRKYMGTNRTSFLIDKKGLIAKIYSQVKPANHVQEVIVDVQSLLR